MTTQENAETHLSFFRSLRGKLILLFLAISLIPLIIVGWMAYHRGSTALEQEVINKLISVRDIKARQITNYFEERLDDLKVFSNNPTVVAATQALHHAEEEEGVALGIDEAQMMEKYRSLYLGKPNRADAGDGSAYSAAHAQYHAMFKEYKETYGYYDIFLVEKHDGHIIYSVEKEDDFGTSLIAGPYAKTNIGEVFRKALASNNREATFMVDFADYEPSKGAAAFVASPIFHNNELEAVLIFQMSEAQIDAIMQERAGLGETGETILVSSEDFLMRSNSPLFEESTLFKQKVDTEASRASAAGETGVKEIIDYRGQLSLVAYTPLKISGVRWSLSAKIDHSEALAAANKMLVWIIFITGIGMVIIIGVALFFSNTIAKPVQNMTRIARQLADGNIKQTVSVKNRDEIGLMAHALGRMIANLRLVIEDIVRISQGLAEGNLRVTPQSEYRGDFIQIQNALGTALSNQLQVVEDIVQMSQGLAAGEHKVTAHAEYRGNFVQIKNALETASVKLSDATKKTAMQDWLKTGQTQLNDLMSGEQDIVTLSTKIISFLTTYVDAELGLFYLVKESELQIIATYAYTATDNRPDKYLFGEGLIGQAAMEQKTLSRVHTQDEHAYIRQSSLAIAVPRQVQIVPFMYENAVKGVIEIGFSKIPSPLQLEFLEQVKLSIGIALNSAQSRTQMQVLLEKTQQQADELQAQKDELQQKQEQLQQSNEALQTQSEELQTQSEELQSQQEELRQINEELEERTKELERQQDDIRQKNEMLEESQVEMAKAKAAIETKAHELEVASKYKSEFLANMSHELRTPLNSLLILAQLLGKNKKGNLSEDQVKYAQTIHSAGSDLLKLINEILDLSKVEAGKIELQTENVSLTALVEKIEQKFRPLADNKGLTFNIKCAEEQLHTDALRIQQILNNLLSNAFKFTSEGEIELRIQREAMGIAISVTDSGIGISKDKQQVIFEAFQQAESTTNRRYGGTGLGLSISRQLAKRLGGDLQVHSEEGKGSTFTLYLPENIEPKPSEEPPAAQTSGEPAAPETPLTQGAIVDDRDNLSPGDQIILIIEDDRQFSKILINLANEKQFKYLLAEDGKTGLQMAQQYKPNAIILDVGLPQMDGWTVMEMLKNDPQTRHIPVHFMSGDDNSMDAKQMGAIGYLHKPVNMEQLANAFNSIKRFITKTVKKLLLVVENESRQQQIVDLVGDVQITVAVTVPEALEHLKKADFDCIIIDAGIKLLEALYKDDQLSQIPVIISAERDLTSSEEAILQQYAKVLTVKTVRSPARLLDEATRFLHQVADQLPEDKRQMLQMVHDKEGILKDKKVLIVDDDVRNVFALMNVLEESQMEVIVGHTGQEGLSLLEEHQDIDIVLMDIMMPEMDGYEAMQKIREQPRLRQLPIIALTAKAMKGDKAKCLEAGANDYLSKPVDTDKLLSLMRVWLYQ
jgi:signal transduction histidine kinase/DNA-binding response OmpR family regulator/methyl-accepting chemotaxis protein